ncbi:LytTR family DNA-binding domain-containing protein [Dyella sp.]|uniref:LytTR family DNA-binding domain-containing protein n=1 Tax=Dyella sp. TaxID=1869338 RepID=UPI003217DD22
MKQRSFDLLAVAGIFAAYTVTIRLALGTDLAGSLLGGLANTIPVVIFGLAVRHIVLRWLVGRPVALQLGAHLLLCAAFATLSYWLLIMLLGLFVGASPEGFVIRPFKAGAVAWQTLENVTTYALIAAISHLQAMHKAAPAVADPVPAAVDAVPADSTDAAPSRYFVRIGDELRPLDLDTVVSIGGADDYAEVRTLTGKHLVRVTLAEFARSLDPAKFARVHRSWIVNTHYIASAEPAGGGRLLLHLENGQTVSTSRDGARLLRDRVI